MGLTTKQVDYEDDQDAADLIRLLSEYAESEAGDETPDLSRLPSQLAALPNAFSVLAYEDPDQQSAVGLINCFFGFSTFQGRPLVNVHDVIVTERCRGQGVGGVMLTRVERIAREHGCCRLTLEVYADNTRALRAYHKHGFGRDPANSDVDILFLRKPLLNNG